MSIELTAEQYDALASRLEAAESELARYRKLAEDSSHMSMAHIVTELERIYCSQIEGSNDGKKWTDRAVEGTRRSRRVEGSNDEFTHCKKGHELTPENTAVRANGKRRCLTCQREELERLITEALDAMEAWPTQTEPLYVTAKRIRSQIEGSKTIPECTCAWQSNGHGGMERTRVCARCRQIEGSNDG